VRVKSNCQEQPATGERGGAVRLECAISSPKNMLRPSSNVGLKKQRERGNKTNRKVLKERSKAPYAALSTPEVDYKRPSTKAIGKWSRLRACHSRVRKTEPIEESKGRRKEQAKFGIMTASLTGFTPVNRIQTPVTSGEAASYR